MAQLLNVSRDGGVVMITGSGGGAGTEAALQGLHEGRAGGQQRAAAAQETRD